MRKTKALLEPERTETPGASPAPAWTATLLLASLCIAAYAPAFNNGFIADDYVILQRTEILKTDPGYLFTVVPENFRATSYVVFSIFRAAAGYDARWFYTFTICLHIINCILFLRLLYRLESNRYAALIAAVLFAVFQAPQEAVMWAAAMNELLQGFFILSAMLLWEKRRDLWSVVCFSIALISKESAIVMLLMIPLCQAARGRPLLERRYLGFLIPAAVFSFVFLYTVSNNFMLTSGSYVIGFQAPKVIVKTLFRLTWPWLYIVVAMLLWKRARRFRSSELLGYGLWLAVPVLPYMFINYQHHLPSRQLYMVSMVLVSIFARLVSTVPSMRLQLAFVVGFVAFNIQYLWLKKDRQFVERASSTTELVDELKQLTPSKIRLIDFPYPQIAIAKAAAVTVPGWEPELIEDGETGATCSDCVVLRWDAKNLRYVR